MCRWLLRLVHGGLRSILHAVLERIAQQLGWQLFELRPVKLPGWVKQSCVCRRCPAAAGMLSWIWASRLKCG